MEAPGRLAVPRRYPRPTSLQPDHLPGLPQRRPSAGGRSQPAHHPNIARVQEPEDNVAHLHVAKAAVVSTRSPLDLARTDTTQGAFCRSLAGLGHDGSRSTAQGTGKSVPAIPPYPSQDPGNDTMAGNTSTHGKRTTVTLPPGSLAKAQGIARARRVGLGAVIEEWVAEGLRADAARHRRDEILANYRKAFAGFSDDDLAVLDGIMLHPVDAPAAADQ